MFEVTKVFYDNLNLYNLTVGCNSKSPPIRYVVVEPIDQKAVDEMIGPKALREKTKTFNIKNQILMDVSDQLT